MRRSPLKQYYRFNRALLHQYDTSYLLSHPPTTDYLQTNRARSARARLRRAPLQTQLALRANTAAQKAQYHILIADKKGQPHAVALSVKFYQF